MGLYLALENYDEILTSVVGEVYIVNDHPLVTEEDRNTSNRMTRTIYNNQNIYSNIPRCECGIKTGAYRLGSICKECRTAVRDVYDTDLQPRAWLRTPEGVAKFINPTVWTMLSARFTKSKYNIIEWLCNTDYTTNANAPTAVIEELLAQGVQRGYNNFVKHFDEYYSILSNMKYYEKRGYDSLKTLIEMSRSCVFSRYMPLPNKSLLIVENTHFARYMDPTIEKVFDAITLMQGIDSPLANYSLRQKENRTAKAIIRLAEYDQKIKKEQLAQKSGLFRKKKLGTRMHYSTRSVIISNTKPHRYDELKISWGQGITIFGQHLYNKLEKRGFTPNEAMGMLVAHVNKFSPLINELFLELFAETKNKRGFCVIYVNN